MTKKSIMQAIAEFIVTCPQLKEFEGLFPKVGVEILEENPTSYMIQSVPAEPKVKGYLDGSGIYRTVFAFESREYYDEIENIDTSKFYEDFAEWLDDCTREKVFPQLGNGLEPRKIKATTPGYLYDAEGTKAKYRIQCVMEYYKPKK